MKRRHKRSTIPGKPGSTPLPLGKIPPRLLDKVLRAAVIYDPAVLQGPGLGTDAAIVLPPQGELLSLTSDPITFTPSELGRHLLAVNINDLVTTGACPRWLLLTLLLPPGTTEQGVESIFESIGEACKHYEIALVGGHTEITDAVSRPVAVGVLTGTVKRDRKVDPSRAEPGDHILLVGPIAIEGTAVLARERGREIESALGRAMRERAVKLLDDPGICIRDAALLAASRYLTHALHDPTEGGLATALLELADLTGWGVDVDATTVEVLPETEAICGHFGIDPFGLLASGSLLVVLPENDAMRLQRTIEDALDVSSTIIGVLTEQRECVWKDARGNRAHIPEFARDEIVRVLEKPEPKRPRPRGKTSQKKR